MPNTNPFSEPEVADLWESTADIVGDAALARQVIEHLARELWEMPWEKWHRLASSARG